MAEGKHPASNGATVGRETRGVMDAAKCGHAVLSLVFLKCISEAGEEPHPKLEAYAVNPAGVRSAIH